MASSRDPFPAIRAEIEKSVHAVNRRTQLVPKSGADRAAALDSIESECKSLAQQVDEIGTVMAVVFQTPDRYGLMQADITLRKEWIASTKRQVQDIQRQVDSARQIPARTVQASQQPPANRYGQAVTSENDRFMGSEEQKQIHRMREQDVQLGDIESAVTRIKTIGVTINAELVQQDHLLTALEEDVDGTQNRLAAAQRKLNNVLEKMGMRGQFCLVVFLLVILALLMFVAFH